MWPSQKIWTLHFFSYEVNSIHNIQNMKICHSTFGQFFNTERIFIGCHNKWEWNRGRCLLSSIFGKTKNCSMVFFQKVECHVLIFWWQEYSIFTLEKKRLQRQNTVHRVLELSRLRTQCRARFPSGISTQSLCGCSSVAR